MKVAIVHDWLYTYAGAEKVLEQMLICFPEADLFSLIDFMPENARAFLDGRKVRTSFIQRMPFAKNKHRHYLPLMPFAIEQFDLRKYDLVISSSHAVAKGVLTGPHQLHICYCHSPIRYAWDMQHQYLEESNLTHGIKSLLSRYLLHRIRLWDYRTANGVDYFIANSKFIASRIKKVYRRESEVIHPPVNIDKFALSTLPRENFYLTASRLVPYKKISLIAASFRKMTDLKLKIVGVGPDETKIKEIIKGAPNIEYLGFVKDDELVLLMQKAKAFVFAAEEDFGIIPVEAQACGTPVIAYKRGGTVETVVDTPENLQTGAFFTEQSVDSIIDTIIRFERSSSIQPKTCRENAEKFSELMFRSRFIKFVTDCYQKFMNQA